MTKGSELQAGFDKLGGGISTNARKTSRISWWNRCFGNGNAKINTGLNKLQAKLPELSISIKELDNGGKIISRTN